jgi:uroporphyrinogen III methyltransferase / synthase
MNAGTVYIVGAGPGDPSLISVRGQRYLAAADVVVHDNLVHPRLLRRAPADAERIDVGAAAPQPLQQDAINLLLAEKAREGKTVVRLKWGDPFVFDSGGKEALFLHEQGIRFEVVPGITAPVAAPAYAGVPVTYPGAGDTLTFIRGHEDGSQKAPRVDWETIARLDGTIVCYAGPRQLPGLVEALLTAGRSPKDWSAVIFRGTLPQQRTVHGMLGEIEERLSESGVDKDAGVLVVGAVAGLREHLRWFDARPLFGKRVLVTRSREQAGELVDLLEDLGAEPIEAPSIRIVPPADYAPLDAAVAEAGRYDWIVFTSANGVEWFMRRLLAGPDDVRSLKGPRLCAIGPATADRLARYGIKVDLMPVEYRAEAILDALGSAADLAGARVLLPRADIAREMLAEELRRAGAEVTEVAAYRTIRETLSRAEDPDIYKMLLEGEIDVVMFTSASTVRNFAEGLGEEQAADLLRQTVVACIGPVTAEAAERLDIHTRVIPSDYTIPALVQAIVDYYQDERAGAAVERG